MSNREENNPSFKVVDKRRFNDEGDVIIGKEREVKEETLRPPANERPKIDFTIFIQSIAHQAMIGLGIAPWPDSGLVKIELNLAQEMIDILKILQEKTKNNLDQAEENLINTIVYQLQLAYVEELKSPKI